MLSPPSPSAVVFQATHDALTSLPNRLREVVRPRDTVARLGGDEFVVLCEHIQGQAALAGLSLSVNLAARQLLAPDLTDLVEETLAQARLDPHHLFLEITESVLLEDGDASAHALRRLKSIGVGIGVDDFGTGFSSLTYLKRFPVDILKIDRSLVAGLGRDREDPACWWTTTATSVACCG